MTFPAITTLRKLTLGSQKTYFGGRIPKEAIAKYVYIAECAKKFMLMNALPDPVCSAPENFGMVSNR